MLAENNRELKNQKQPTIEEQNAKIAELEAVKAKMLKIKENKELIAQLESEVAESLPNSKNNTEVTQTKEKAKKSFKDKINDKYNNAKWYQQVGMGLAPFALLAGGVGTISLAENAVKAGLEEFANTETMVVTNRDGSQKNIEISKAEKFSSEEIEAAILVEINNISDETGIELPNLIAANHSSMISKFRENYDQIMEESIETKGEPIQREIELLRKADDVLKQDLSDEVKMSMIEEYIHEVAMIRSIRNMVVR